MIDLIPKDGYWLGEVNIAKIEKLKNAKYMGYFCTKKPSGSWNESPVDVFYVENPDTSLEHSNYFGVFYKGSPGINKSLYITNALSCFDEPIIGLQFEDGWIMFSRYRHDSVEYQGIFIDGGRDYTRLGGNLTKVKKISITVKDGEFVIDDSV